LYYHCIEVSKNRMTSIINPVQLAGLQQAPYVMGCLVRNDSEEQIVKMLGGDEQLYDMWKSFLKHNNWIIETLEGCYITAKGAMWNKRIACA
jgi:hypothetical protein